MPTVRVPIKSSSNPANTNPWAVTSFDPITRVVTVDDFNGLRDSEKENAIKGTRTLALKPGKLTERHYLIVTNAGVLAFVPVSEIPSTYYCDLAIYEPTTQTVTILDFVEE